MSFAAATVADVQRAVASASCVSLSAYLLPKSNPLVHDLEAAAERGASVTVVLDGVPLGAGPRSDGAIGRANAATLAELRAHGVDARANDGVASVQHLKAVVVDGRAFLDDRNWTSTDDLVATSDPGNVACVASAIDGRPCTTPELATTKAEALACEASTIASGTGDRVDCISESFGSTVVSSALARRAEAGAHVRLIVSSAALAHASSNERRALGRLLAAGVEVSAGRTSDKLCVAGAEVWLGSANATCSPPPPMLDWGLQTADVGLVRRAGDTFAHVLANARRLDRSEVALLVASSQG